jgi:hypothetical protein
MDVGEYMNNYNTLKYIFLAGLVSFVLFFALFIQFESAAAGVLTAISFIVGFVTWKRMKQACPQCRNSNWKVFEGKQDLGFIQQTGYGRVKHRSAWGRVVGYSDVPVNETYNVTREYYSCRYCGYKCSIDNKQKM